MVGWWGGGVVGWWGGAYLFDYCEQHELSYRIQPPMYTLYNEMFKEAHKHDDVEVLRNLVSMLDPNTPEMKVLSFFLSNVSPDPL